MWQILNLKKTSINLLCWLATTLVLAQAAELEPIKLELAFVAGDNINVSEMHRPSPIEVCLYELKSAQIFDNSDYFSLKSRDAEVLTGEMLKKDCFVMRPGERRKIERKSDPATTVLGILAGYREIDRFVWRATYKLPEAPQAGPMRAFMPSVKSVALIQIGEYGLRVREIK